MGADRPSVWLVSPAFGRYAVTRLALAQRAHLAGVLADRGVDCHSVVVADDENLDIAREHGMATIEMGNDGLGRRFNAGFEYAGAHGADWLVHIGSDDWLHPDAFAPITDRHAGQDRIIAGRRIAFVDLLTGLMRPVPVNGGNGVIPWIVPRAMMAPTGFRPIREDRMRGIDGYLIRGLKARSRVQWLFHDASDYARVDFKSDVGINTYRALPCSFTRGPQVDPWPLLAEHYPAELVALARRTSLDFQEVASCRS